MAKTIQAEFDETYHHIDSPTKLDDSWTGAGKKRYIELNKNTVSDLDALNLESYYFTYKRKLDGENMRVKWDGEQALWNGKTNKFATTQEFSNYMNSTFAEEVMEEVLGRDKTYILFGEHMGPKSQGNELGLDKDEFILFDVKVGDVFLDKNGIIDIATCLKIHSVYDYMLPNLYLLPLQDLIDLIFSGRLSKWEGIVIEPVGQLRNRKGERIIYKIKNRDYIR